MTATPPRRRGRAPIRRVRRDVTIDGERYRMLTAGLPSGGAVQAARNLAETDRLLDSLRNRILVAVALVVAAAAGLGWLVARQITRRLVRLTGTAEQVAATGRLDVPVPVDGTDEAGRLGAAFNEMLAALARSKDDQQRLVQDAGHELRTPLTSLRTNISVLRRHDRLAPDTMAKVLDDLDGEARELTDLTNELVELATDRRGDEPSSELSLGALAERVAARAARRTGRRVVVDADAGVVTGRPLMLERAITNLVDNAAKFDEGGEAPIEVVVRQGSVEVLDRGPGIAPADLPHLFDRFYRAAEARGRPGSGTRPGHREGRRRRPRRDRLRGSSPWWWSRRGLQGAGRVIPTFFLTSPGPALARPGHRDHRNPTCNDPWRDP